MGQNAPTLKDIAERLGLSIGTVQRALHNKGGYSPQTQQRVLEEAKRCGYTVNVMASALRRPPINLAAVFPEPVGENRYFFRYVWEGIEKACEELSVCNIRVDRYYADTNGPDGLEVLRRLLRESELQGLVTNASNDPRFLALLEAFSQKKVPVFLVNAVPEARQRLYYCSANQCVGRLGADIFCALRRGAPGKVLLLGGVRSNVRQVARVNDFCAAMAQQCPEEQILECHLYDDPARLRALVTTSLSDGSLSGIYAVSARETLAMCAAVREAGASGRVVTIGTDVFPELLEYFEDRTLTASVYQYPVQQAYAAVRTLVSHIVPMEPRTQPLIFPIAAVFRSNAASFCSGAILI